MDPSNAYPKKELKKWRRHVLLEKPEITLVVDEVQANPGAKIEVRFHPGVDYSVEDGFVMLNGKEGKMALIPLMDKDADIVPGKHASQFVNATKDFHWLDYFDSEVMAKNEKTIIGTLILPVFGTDDAEMITKSIQLSIDGSENLSISFQKGGNQFKYEYMRTKTGLKLRQ